MFAAVMSGIRRSAAQPPTRTLPVLIERVLRQLDCRHVSADSLKEALLELDASRHSPNPLSDAAFGKAIQDVLERRWFGADVLRLERALSGESSAEVRGQLGEAFLPADITSAIVTTADNYRTVERRKQQQEIGIQAMGFTEAEAIAEGILLKSKRLSEALKEFKSARETNRYWTGATDEELATQRRRLGLAGHALVRILEDEDKKKGAEAIRGWRKSVVYRARSVKLTSREQAKLLRQLDLVLPYEKTEVTVEEVGQAAGLAEDFLKQARQDPGRRAGKPRSDEEKYFRALNKA